MHLAIVYGTRPEFLKLKSVIDQFRYHGVSMRVVRINQHINFTEDDGYYNEKIEIESSTNERLTNIGSTILQKLPEFIGDCTHVLAQGDTASVFYTLLCAFQLKKKCIHLEAGMRTYDLWNPYPEEGYRQMISRITDIHLCPSETEKKNLEMELVKGEKYIIGNTILDLVKSYNFPVTFTNNVLITLHRRENWDMFKDYIYNLFSLAEKNPTFLFQFFTHPNPSLKQILEELKEQKPTNILIMPPVTHKTMIELVSACAFVITDSGGIQEEANFLGKHMFVLRKITERSAICANKLSLCDVDSVKSIKCSQYIHTPGLEYGDGNSASKLFNILTEYLNKD